MTRPRLGGVIVVLCAVNLLVAADFLGASVLLDPIGRDLHMDTATLALTSETGLDHIMIRGGDRVRQPTPTRA